MRNLVAMVLVAVPVPPAWGATYSYVGLPYSTEIAFLQNYTPPCTTGSCATYTGNMQVTGYINTAAPVLANLNKPRHYLDHGFSFSDGVHTFPSTDPLVIAAKPFIANTDAAGNITSLSVVLARWQSSVVPDATGSRLGSRRARRLQRRSRIFTTIKGRRTTIARPTRAPLIHAAMPQTIPTRATAPTLLGTWTTSTPSAASLENPQPGSFQSGIGLLSGWSCQGPNIGIAIDGNTALKAPYGSARADTASVCGAANTSTGFGLLLNFNTLGAGLHSA